MKNIKNIKLLLIISLIVSCTPNVNNILPSPNKTNNPSPKVSNSPNLNVIPSQSPKGSDTPTITPSITISTPSPSPSITPNYPIIKGVVRKFYSLDDNISFNDNTGLYRMLINEKRRFSAEIYIDGIVYNDIVFESSNSHLLSIDSNGIATTFGGTGEVIIKAYLRKTPSISTSLKIQILETLLTKKPQYDKDCNTIYVDYTLNRAENPFIPPNYSGDVGVTLDISERATFNGKVFDPNGVPVDKAIVNARAFICDASGNVSFSNWVGEAQETIGGAYVFRNAPIGARVQLTVTKDGWTTRTKNEMLKSNLNGDPTANVFNFDGIYAIQDEPEIVSLKVNGKQVLKSSKDEEFDISKNSPKNSKPTALQMDNDSQINNIGNVPELTGVNSNTLEVEMIFSEPIKVSDVQNYFRITSQSGFDNRTKNFTIDANYSGVEFTISADEKTITFKANKAILSNKEGQEARYLIDFSQAFRDKTDKAAIDRRYFRFSNTQMNDFALFSVKNDETAPKLLGITARDGGSANDTIELKYSEPMELINQASYPAGLADPLAPTNLSRQLWYRDANNFKANNNSITNSTNDNNGTLVGFLDNSDSDISQFKASYMIGRILSTDVLNGTPKLSILGNKNRLPNINPVKGNTTSNDLLRNARITGSNVILEFSPDAFDRDDIVVLSVGKDIKGLYKNSTINEDLSVNSLNNPQFTQIYDPAGRLIDSSNPEVSNNVDVNNIQRAVRAS